MDCYPIPFIFIGSFEDLMKICRSPLPQQPRRVAQDAQIGQRLRGGRQDGRQDSEGGQRQAAVLQQGQEDHQGSARRGQPGLEAALRQCHAVELEHADDGDHAYAKNERKPLLDEHQQDEQRNTDDATDYSGQHAVNPIRLLRQA